MIPIQTDFALLSQLHNSYSGEPEATGQATVRITVEKDMSLKFPRVRAGNETICIGIADSIDAARQLAMDQAYDFLTIDHR